MERIHLAMRYAANTSNMNPSTTEKVLGSWAELSEEIRSLREKYTDLRFRGLADSAWRLTTTLERSGCERMPLGEYYILAAQAVRPALETITGERWRIRNYSIELEREFTTDKTLIVDHRFPKPEMYRYMIFLRHHGFPSPLLDWSVSPYVAAFFAFRDVAGGEKRSIYVYCETPSAAGKGGAVGEPWIYPIGRYIRSHPRHFQQQSDYTICVEFKDQLGWHFHPHEPVFGGRGRQDLLWKLSLPSSERENILAILDEYNLNAFSLFGSQESLLETLWFRESRKYRDRGT